MCAMVVRVPNGSQGYADFRPVVQEHAERHSYQSTALRKGAQGTYFHIANNIHEGKDLSERPVNALLDFASGLGSE